MADNDFQADLPKEDLSLTTYEQAKRCPKCGMPGDVRKQVSVPGLAWGVRIHEVYCVTKLCPWFDTPWMVQVNADGSVPPPRDHTLTKKEYVGFEGHDQQALDLITDLKVSEQMKQNGRLDPSIDRDPLDPFNKR